MSIDQHNLPRTTNRLALCWKGAQQAYKTLNSATRCTIGMLFKLLVIGYFIFCGLFLGLRYVVLPNIDNYKGDIEQMATRALGNRVSIATIDASWKGLRPHLALGNVVIHDKSGKEALRLPKVSVTASWWSAVVGDLRLHSLEIDRPDMDILRDADGNIYVAGMFIDTRKSGKPKLADWILSQHEIVIRGGRLRWNDRQRGAPELALEDVNIVLRNRWLDHRFSLRATPPTALAAPIDVRAVFSHPHFSGNISDATRWKGVLYTDLRDTDLAAWKAWFDYPIDMQQGTGAVRAWLNFDHAKIADFTADLMLVNVSARLRKDLEPLTLAQVDGRVSMREEFGPFVADGIPTFGANGHAVTLTNFSMRTADGLTLPRTTISERFFPARDGKPERIEISSSMLDLKPLADFVTRLPLPAAQRRMVADFAPRGVLKDFSAKWQGTYPEIASYSIKGEFIDLSLNAQPPHPAKPSTGKQPGQAAVPAIPGFENLTGRVDANDRGGTFHLASDNLKLQLPGYFVDPVMPFDRLDMDAAWAFQGNDKLLLEVRRMDFAQEGLSGSMWGKHLMPLNHQLGKSFGTIDASGRLTGLDLQKIDRYLPLTTPEHLRDWLAGALVGGTADDVRVKIKGDLDHFPFRVSAPGEKPKGEFSIVGRINNGKLNYAPGHFAADGKSPQWPLLEEIKGTIAFDRTRMEIKAHSAKTEGVDLSNVKAVIADLSNHDMMLAIEGDAAGALQDFIRYTKDSPVAEWIGHFTDEIKTAGNAKLGLKLQLPLAHMIESKVQGSLQFANNNVTLFNVMPPLSAVNGKLGFNEKGVSLSGIKANFLGGPVSIAGGTQRDGTILVKADGSLTADGIRKTYPMPVTQNSTDRITGSTRYSASIRVKNKQPEIVVESNLAGLTLNFPAPLRKAANETMPLRFEQNGLPSNDASLLRDEMKLSLGSMIAARYEREKSVDKDAQWRVVRGGLGVNVPAPQPDSGLIANVNMKSLDIDAWRRVATSIATANKPAEMGKQGESLDISQYIEPEVLAARATELIVLGKKLDNVVVGASHQKDVWQANIDSEQASGYVTWNESQSGRGLGRVSARLASLIIPESAASDVTELLEGTNEATRMPGVDIIAENFELFGKKFGHFELAANNVRGTAGQEWRISKLWIVNPDGELRASGKWSAMEGGNTSSLNYVMDIANAGKLLDRFGFAHVIKGGKGKMEGDISWKGLPFSLDIPSLSGQLHLDIADGQFLKGDQSAAKLLGVLSLQSLPRRLALDFRDVFSEGFAFDGVNAAATITQGVVKTDNFKMRGLGATVLIDGIADIGRESQNLHVVVIPEINAGAASVVYALAVNPVIGVGTFLAQLFLRDPLMKAFTFEYQVTGPWKDPVVTKVGRKPVNPAGEVPPEAAKSG